jgi:hypothetical protein
MKLINKIKNKQNTLNNNSGFTIIEFAMVILIITVLFTFVLSPYIVRMKSFRCQAMANNIDSEVREYIDWFKGMYTYRDKNHDYYNPEFETSLKPFIESDEPYYILDMSISELNDKYNMEIESDYYQCVARESVYVGEINGDSIETRIPLPILTSRNMIEFSLAEKIFLYGEFHDVPCPLGHLDNGEVIEYCSHDEYQLSEKQDKSYRSRSNIE